MKERLSSALAFNKDLLTKHKTEMKDEEKKEISIRKFPLLDGKMYTGRFCVHLGVRRSETSNIKKGV